jgi:hypothetical protein
MPQVEVPRSCTQGRIAEFTLHQQDVLKQGYAWPIRLQMYGGMHFEVGAPQRPSFTLRVHWKDADYVAMEAIGRECLAYVFTNFNDQACGRFLLDPVSQSAMKPFVPDDDALLHSMLWGTLWDNVRLAQSSPRSLAEVELVNLPKDEMSDEHLFGSRAHGFLWRSTRIYHLRHVRRLYREWKWLSLTGCCTIMISACGSSTSEHSPRSPRLPGLCNK